MKAMRMAAACAALMVLTACDQLGLDGLLGEGETAAANQTDTNATTNLAGANTSQDSQQQTADAGGKPGDSQGGMDDADATRAGSTYASGGVTLDRAYILGRWGDDGNCSDAIVFNTDGRWVAANGATGLWNLAGDRLTVTGNQTLTLQIVPVDQNTMTVVNPDGSLGRSERC